MFGNVIYKGGSEHRVSFSFHGDMKIIENWKHLNKKYSFQPDYSYKLGKGKGKGKKNCMIF